MRIFYFSSFSRLCRVAPSLLGSFATSSSSGTASLLFIAFLRHGHEVGGDAAPEVKTMRAAAIGPERESRPIRAARGER